MDFHQSFKKCSIFTPDIRKQPHISLNGILKLNEVWPLEGTMYISLWENSRGHPDNVSFMQFSTKIDRFEQKDSQGFENSYNSYEQYPLEKFFIFTIYQNYTLALTSSLLIPTLFQVIKSVALQTTMSASWFSPMKSCQMERTGWKYRKIKVSAFQSLPITCLAIDLSTNFMHTILTKVVPDSLKACSRFIRHSNN